MTTPNWANETMWTADNLPILRGMNSGSVDLIYLDPPFNSKHNYAAPIGSKAAGAAFKDTWTLSDIDLAWLLDFEKNHPAITKIINATLTDSDKAYLIYMAPRLLELHRILKSSGTIYLHCDPTMSHYLKIIMDAIFGRKMFRNEIVWCYRGGGVPKYDFARKHDVLLRYSKTKQVTFNVNDIRLPYSDDVLSSTPSRYNKSYRANKVYEGYSPNKKGKHPEDWWPIQPIMPSSKERTGYPTQKPLVLLDRVIKASSNEGDMVLDPFCGCATACVSAHNLNREWTGIDISEKAYHLVRDRIADAGGLFYNLTQRTDIPRRTDLGKIPKYNSKVMLPRFCGRFTVWDSGSFFDPPFEVYG